MESDSVPVFQKLDLKIKCFPVLTWVSQGKYDKVPEILRLKRISIPGPANHFELYFFAQENSAHNDTIKTLMLIEQATKAIRMYNQVKVDETRGNLTDSFFHIWWHLVKSIIVLSVIFVASLYNYGRAIKVNFQQMLKQGCCVLKIVW